VYTVFALCSPFFTLSPHPPPSHWYQLPWQDLFSNFVKEKKWHLCLFKIVTQEVSLWHFHVYMYFKLNWFVASIFLLSTLVSFLWWFQQV
jgi:hypothetical protein